MREPIEIAKSALREILDINKSASSGWNAADNMVSVARRALADIEKQEVPDAAR